MIKLLIKNILILGFVVGIKSSLLLKAETCDETRCVLPECKCSTTDSGSGIPIEKIPQIVMLTFDDAVTGQAFHYFEEALFQAKNPDGCPVGATYFVSHEYTNYELVHRLWKQGHEIALHSVTHLTDQNYWRNINLETKIAEFGDLLTILQHFALVPRNDVKGLRLPFLQIGGNVTLQGIKKLNLIWDSSMPTQKFVDPALWPYTFDFASKQECNIPPCPTASFPGVWEIPMISWKDTRGHFCSMVDGCAHIPTTTDAIFEWMLQHFERHYKGSRAPFPVFMHAAWFMRSGANFQAYKRFVQHLGTLPDVYIVNLSKVIEWMQNPKSIYEEKPLGECVTRTLEKTCVPKTCELRTLTNQSRWMTSCVTECPAVYPWLNNPYGL